MKKLSIYKDNDQFVIERINEFNHATKRFFITKDGLKEGLQAYQPVIDQYEVEVSEDLWAFVINLLNSSEFQG